MEEPGRLQSMGLQSQKWLSDWTTVRLQQYMNQELPEVQAGFRNGRRTRDQIANIHWIIEKAREFQKSIYFCFIDYAKASDHLEHNKLWKILKEMGILDHFICLLWNLYACQEAALRIRHGTTDWFQIGKGIYQGCISLPCLFNLCAEYFMWNAGLDEAQAEIKIAVICRWHHPYGRKRGRTKEPLDESEREEWKSWLRTQHSEN